MFLSEIDDNVEYEYEERRQKVAKDLKGLEDIEPIVEDPEVIRAEMDKLYGPEKALEILAMETNMQWNFEKMRDAHNAQLWPCLPLNMKFK